jgi:hypothetical protein
MSQRYRTGPLDEVVDSVKGLQCGNAQKVKQPVGSFCGKSLSGTCTAIAKCQRNRGGGNIAAFGLGLTVLLLPKTSFHEKIDTRAKSIFPVADNMAGHDDSTSGATLTIFDKRVTRWI